MEALRISRMIHVASFAILVYFKSLFDEILVTTPILLYVQVEQVSHFSCMSMIARTGPGYTPNRARFKKNFGLDLGLIYFEKIMPEPSLGLVKLKIK